jgi:hypothetical protein
MTRTSAPFYYQIADRNLRTVHGLPFDWYGGDRDPVVRLTLDRECLAFIENCVRLFEPKDGMAGEIQAVRERVDQLIAGELHTAQGEAEDAARKVRVVKERYGIS